MKCIWVEARNVQRYESVQNQQPSNKKKHTTIFFIARKMKRPTTIDIFMTQIYAECVQSVR